MDIKTLVALRLINEGFKPSQASKYMAECLNLEMNPSAVKKAKQRNKDLLDGIKYTFRDIIKMLSTLENGLNNHELQHYLESLKYRK